jgi:AraC-like DNA-binding protein
MVQSRQNDRVLQKSVALFESLPERSLGGWSCAIANVCQVIAGAVPTLHTRTAALARLNDFVPTARSLPTREEFLISKAIITTTLSRVISLCRLQADLWSMLGAAGGEDDPDGFLLAIARICNTMLQSQEVQDGVDDVDVLEARFTSSDRRIRLALHFIDTNLASRSLNVPCVARYVQLSPAHFDRLFTRAVGTTFRQYIKGRRLSYARSFLSDIDRSVKDVAYSVGYATVASFCRDFRASFGLSPGRFAKEYRMRDRRADGTTNRR